MEHAMKEGRTRTPEEKIWVGVIQQCMEDAFEEIVFKNLQKQYNSGNIDKDKLRTGIRNLGKML